VGLRAPDPLTLIVELERRVPYFIEIVAYEVFGPAYPPLLERYSSLELRSGQYVADPRFLRPDVWVSNGPFVVADYRFRRELRLERNPHYWDPGSISVDSISLPAIRDPNAGVLSVQTGATDWLTDVQPDYRGDMIAAKKQFYAEHREKYGSLVAQGLDPVAIDRRLPRDPRKVIHAFPAFGTYFYNFNCKPRLPDGRPNPFADARVRRAFAMAVDKQHIADKVRRLDERAAATLIPVGTLDGYQSPRGLPSAPDGEAIAAAKRLLAEAGFPDGRGFPTVKILYNAEGGHDKIAAAVKRDWESALNVRVELDVRELSQFRADLRSANYMISRGSWFGDYGDPTTFLELNRSTDGNNDRKFNDPAYDAMLDAAAAEPDPVKRYAILAEAERYTVEEALPLIPIFQYNQVYLFDPDEVSGVSPHPRQKQSIYRLEKLNDGKGADRPLEMPPKPAARPATPAKAGGRS
jgi:oligopeptide transport system substrate-binding protein